MRPTVSTSTRSRCLFPEPAPTRLFSKPTIRPSAPIIVQAGSRRLSGASDKTTYTYDTAQRVRTKTAWAFTSTYAYDNLDRLTTITYPDATTETWNYQISGTGGQTLDMWKYKDRLNRETNYTYNGLRQISKIKDPLNRETLLEWCRCGALQKLTDPKLQVTDWVYDIQGRLVEKKIDGSTVQKLVYEPTRGLLASGTDALGQAKVYTYAFDNRLTNIQYLNDGGATPDVTWQWDQRYPRVTSLVDGVGGTTTYAYGAIGTPAANLLATENLAGANKIITYTYDAVGRLFSRSIDSANSIQYFRDEIGRIKGTITTSGSVGYFYSATDGRLTSVINPVSGQTLNIGYQDTDPIKPPNLRELLVASGSTALAQLDYASINAMGRIGKITSSVSTVWSNTFTYDNADQLTRANTTGTVAPADNRYTYDLAANVEEWRQIISGSSTYFPYTKDDTNFTTAIRRGTTSGTGTPYLTFTKDANGNTTSWSDAISGKSETLTWDAENRLISVAQSPANKQFVMTYDGRNRLIILEEKLSGVSQKKTWLVWSGMELCEERDGNTNAVLTKYFPEGEMQFTAGSWVTLWYFRDNLGSILETYTSATSRQSQRKFDEWGRIAGSAPGPGVSKKGYTGHYQPEGLEYLMAPYRWYSPTTRSWLSRDPIGEAGGVNLYGYVANNPINSTDNLGLAGAGVNVGAGAQVVVVGGAASAGIGAFSDGKSANVGLYGAAVASIPGETGISIGAGVATPGVGIFFSPTANRAEDLNNLTNTAYIFGGWGPGGSLSVSWGGGQFLFECSFPRLPSFGTWGGGLGVGSGPTSGGTLFGK